MKFKLFEYKKYDDIVWERTFRFLKIGKYWMFEISAYDSCGDAFGVHGNFDLAFPISGNLVGVGVNVGAKNISIAVVSKEYKMYEV